MKMNRVTLILILVTCIWHEYAFADTTAIPTWVISPGLGIGTWGYESHYYSSNSSGSETHTEGENADGISFSITAKKTIHPDWIVDVTYIDATEFNIFADVTEFHSIQSISGGISHTKWWKFGYFSGGINAGGAQIQSHDCPDSDTCLDPYKNKAIVPTVGFISDLGVRRGYFGVGIRNDAIIVPSQGIANFIRLHVDLML